MANEMWIIPTQNKEEFYDKESLLKLLDENIPELIFTRHPNLQGGDILVHNLKKYPLFYLGLDSECYLINKEDDIQELDDMGMEDLADKLVYFWDTGPDIKRCINIRHSSYQDEIKLITTFFRKYFGAYIFDEGIHPEFIEPWGAYPTDVEKEKSVISKFKDFLRGI
jgi:hypothetical protein